MTPLQEHARSVALAGERCLLAACLILVPVGTLRAQAEEFSVPPNSILPNYNRVSVGQREALEGGAYVARTDDALANWYNPAGLASSEKTALNASSNVYEITKTTLSGIGEKESGTRFRAVGGFFGIVIGKPIARSDRWRFGFGLTSPVAWAPSSLDGAFNLPAGDATEAFSYSSTVNFNTVIPSLNAAYRVSPTLRAGIGVGYGMTDLTQNQALTDRLVSETGVLTGIRAFSTDGTARHLLLTGGVQWDLARAITVGAIVSPPGFRIGGSSQIRFTQLVFQAAGTEDDLAFGDPEAKFDYKMPFRAAAGATFRYSKGQVELDVRYHGAEDQYELLSSDSTAVRITTDAAGVPTVSAPAFTPVLHQARSIVSFAVGANYSLSRSLRFHAGLFTDPSPVSGPSRSTFRAVNLTGASGGLSLGSGRLTGSVGVSASWGTTTDRAIGPSLGGLQAITDVSIRTFTALYAVSFTF
jgi:long-subunit fatty acid transport protein